jgi:large subunit ribosomal protein L10
MDRSQKADAVAALNATFSEVGVVVVTRNLGMTVAQSTALRGKVREVGATYKVSKNSLAKIAIKGTHYEAIGDLFTGPVALATSVDPVAAAKAVVEFAKTNGKIEIVGGAMGAQVLNAEGIKALDAVARRTAGKACRPRPGTGDQDRPARYRSGGQAGARLRRLCRKRRGVRPFTTHNSPTSRVALRAHRHQE